MSVNSVTLANPPETLPNYETLYSAAKKSLATLPDGDKLYALSEMLGMNPEQLPALSAKFFQKEDLYRIEQTMEYDVMKAGYRTLKIMKDGERAQSKFSIVKIYIKGDTPGVIYKITTSIATPRTIHLTKYHVTAEKSNLCWDKMIVHEPKITAEDRWLIDQSPVFRERAIRLALIPLSEARQLHDDPGSIVYSYAVRNPQKWEENFSDIAPLLALSISQSHFPKIDSFQYLQLVKRMVDLTLKKMIFLRIDLPVVPHDKKSSKPKPADHICKTICDYISLV